MTGTPRCGVRSRNNPGYRRVATHCSGDRVAAKPVVDDFFRRFPIGTKVLTIPAEEAMQPEAKTLHWKKRRTPIINDIYEQLTSRQHKFLHEQVRWLKKKRKNAVDQKIKSWCSWLIGELTGEPTDPPHWSGVNTHKPTYYLDGVRHAC